MAMLERKKGRGVRKPFPSDLPREEVIIDLPESENVCPKDVTALKEIGEQVTEKLKIIPAKLSVVVERKKIRLSLLPELSSASQEQLDFARNDCNCGAAFVF